MNDLQIFENPEFGSIRTTIIDDEPWFVGKDVATSLGYAKPSVAISKKIDNEDRGVSEMETPSGKQKMTIINESGLYCLILSSKLESAKKFKRWVTSEVLPAIRKTGVYKMPQARQRDLTTDDYLRAAHIVSRCRNERLPYVINLLESAGLYISEVKTIAQSIQNVPYPDIDLVELLNRYSLKELCERLKICKGSLYYYRIGRYKPLPERRKYIIETLE